METFIFNWKSEDIKISVILQLNKHLILCMFCAFFFLNVDVRLLKGRMPFRGTTNNNSLRLSILCKLPKMKNHSVKKKIFNSNNFVKNRLPLFSYINLVCQFFYFVSFILPKEYSFYHSPPPIILSKKKFNTISFSCLCHLQNFFFFCNE